MSEIATTEGPSLVPIPRSLSELGIRIAEDAASGNRLVLIPASVRQHVNVIDPVTSLVQADPNWTPRISVVELNPDAKNGPHFYEQAGRKLAPTKQALEVLAKAAGILSTQTARVPRAELDEGEIGYRATVTIRRSDGTVETVHREKVWVKDAERAEVEQAVTDSKFWENGQKTDRPKFDLPATPAWKAEVEKRWLKELKDRYAKTESKAVLRAIRSALQIPHTFTPADAAKPFLVIGFNFTPDYNDVEIRRMLVSAGLNAQAAIYGGPELERLDTVTGEITAGTATPEEQPADDAVGSDGGDGQQAEGPALPLSPAEPSAPGSEPDLDDDEPAAAAFTIPASALDTAAIDALGDTIVKGEKTLRQVVAAGEKGAMWLKWALDTLGDDDERLGQIRVYLQHREAELWAELTGGEAS